MAFEMPHPLSSKPVNQHWFVAWGTKERDSDIVGFLFSEKDDGSPGPLVGSGRPLQRVDGLPFTATDWALQFEGLKGSHHENAADTLRYTVQVYQVRRPISPATLGAATSKSAIHLYHFRSPIVEHRTIEHLFGTNRPEAKDILPHLKKFGEYLRCHEKGITGVNSAQANNAFYIYGTHNDPYPNSLMCTVTKKSDNSVAAQGVPLTVADSSTQFSYYFPNGLPIDQAQYESHVVGSQTHFSADLTIT